MDELNKSFFEELTGGEPDTPSRMRGNIFKRKKQETLATQCHTERSRKKTEVDLICLVFKIILCFNHKLF